MKTIWYVASLILRKDRDGKRERAFSGGNTMDPLTGDSVGGMVFDSRAEAEDKAQGLARDIGGVWTVLEAVSFSQRPKPPIHAVGTTPTT